MSEILLALLAAYWFQRELNHFAHRLNWQIYSDLQQLQQTTLSFDEFLQHSSLKPCSPKVAQYFYWLCPAVMLIFHAQPLPLQLIALCLVYLSVLDYCYYLTDSRYIGGILWLAVAHLLWFQPENLSLNLLNALFSSAFFVSFALLAKWLARQEMLGFGDVILFIALSPLFEFEQMVSLILYAALLGLAYALLYFCKFQRKIARLPFIPFISLSTFWLIIVKLPFSF